MSDSIAPLNLADDADRWLDRLADGELNPDEQRRLLAALETHPDGWRRWRSRLSKRKPCEPNFAR